MHRTPFAHVLGFLILLVLGQDAIAREAIRAPLSCEIVAGRPIVRPATPRLYEIVSAREKLPFTACAPDDATQCRSIMLHRFEVACGSERVPWIELASALVAGQGGRAWINQGRLNIARMGQAPHSRADDCNEKMPAAPGGRDDAATASGCNRGARQRLDAGAWSLPAGFAPLAELGVVLISAPATAETPPPQPSRAASSGNIASPSMGLGSDGIGGAKREPANVAMRAPEMRPKQQEIRHEPPAPVAPVQSPPQTAATPVQQQPVDVVSTVVVPTVPPPAPAAPPASASYGAVETTAAAPPPSPVMQVAVLQPASLEPSEASPTGTYAQRTQGSPPQEREEEAVADASAVHEEPPAEKAAEPLPQEAPVLRIVSGSGWTPSRSAEEQTWLPKIEPAAVAEVVVNQFRELRLKQEFMVIMGVALVSGLLTGVGWFASRSWRVSVARMTPAERFAVATRPTSTALATQDAQMCGELCTTAYDLLRQIDVTVEDLKSVAPLRRVLQREMRHLQQFLTAVTAASPAEEEEWRRMRNRLQRIVKELMRLKEIVDGAQRSLSAPGALGMREPRDRHEAYDVLGVHADISPKILKKLVEALRACWHPDLAKDESDRLVREERMKRINIAWDIINDRRQEA